MVEKKAGKKSQPKIMDEAHFKDLILPHQHLMMGMALRMLGNREHALDCMQECLTTLWKARDQLPKVSCISSYCLTCVRNRCLSMLRERNRTDNLLGNDGSSDASANIADDIPSVLRGWNCARNSR